MKLSVKHISILTTIAAAGLFVTGCNSPAEKAADNTADVIEDDADAVRETGENVADKVEDRGDAAEKAMDNKADAIENAADAVRDKADGK